MALRPTIYKMRISLSDLERERYETLNLTVARHPSETAERMLARVLAYCLNASEALAFCKGLSDAEEPDLWEHALDGRINLWIEVGEPAFERVKKASRTAGKVKVYCFNTRASVWWNQGREKFAALPVEIRRFDWPALQALAGAVGRTTDLSVMVSGESLHVAGESGTWEVACETLQG